MTRVWSCLLVLWVLTAACAGGGAGRELTQTLDTYEKYIRWNELQQAITFVDPKTRAENPNEAFELERFEHVRVTGYEVRARDLTPDQKELVQTVQLTLYNVHNLRERRVVDRQRWRYDEASERWLLVSGLPDIGRR